MMFSVYLREHSHCDQRRNSGMLLMRMKKPAKSSCGTKMGDRNSVTLLTFLSAQPKMTAMDAEATLSAHHGSTKKKKLARKSIHQYVMMVLVSTCASAKATSSGNLERKNARRAEHAHDGEEGDGAEVAGQVVQVGVVLGTGAVEDDGDQDAKPDGDAEANAQRAGISDDVLELPIHDPRTLEEEVGDGVASRSAAGRVAPSDGVAAIVVASRRRHRFRWRGHEEPLLLHVVLADFLHDEHDEVRRVGVVRQGVAGVLEEVDHPVALAIVHDPAGSQQDHGVEEVKHLGARLVDGAADGGAAGGHLPKQLHDGLRGRRVEARRRFVQEHHGRPGDEIHPDRRALPLAAADAREELAADVGVCAAAQAQLVQQVVHELRTLLGRLILRAEPQGRREGQRLSRRRRGQQRIVLHHLRSDFMSAPSKNRHAGLIHDGRT
eukprot:scaffold2850_cov235-Pinguiococcus_pyrenoidosus.AAC.7